MSSLSQSPDVDERAADILRQIDALAFHLEAIDGYLGGLGSVGDKQWHDYQRMAMRIARSLQPAVLALARREAILTLGNHIAREATALSDPVGRRDQWYQAVSRAFDAAHAAYLKRLEGI